MSKATRKTTPRLRKQRYSDAELSMLADTLAAHADIIQSHDKKREVQQQKSQIWQEVARKVSAVGTTPRSVRDCRKRWDDLRVRVRNIMANNRREAMATGGGAHPPAKLMPWEETASRFISPDSIEGLCETETGAASTAEGGTDEEEATQETTARASTSHPKKRATTTTTSAGDKQATPTPVQGESLEAPASTGEELDASVEPEGDTEVTCPATPSPVPTPSPQHLQSPTCSEADPCLRDCDLPTSEEYSPENAVHVTAQPTTPAPSKTLETRLSMVEAQQEAMLDLLRQYIADGEETRRGIATAIAGTTAAIAANTAAVNASARLMRDCLGAVTQVLTSMLLHMQRPRLAGGVEPASDSPTTSTPASSVPTSPVRQTRRSARHTEMPPPDRKKSRK